jgi:CBS domain-containing protein
LRAGNRVTGGRRELPAKGKTVTQKVSDLMTPAPVSLRSAQTLTEAAKAMLEHDIGAVLVVDDRGDLRGMVTDRDIVVRAIADERDPRQTPVADVSSPDLVVVSPNDDADIALQNMRDRGVRRIPVVEHGRPVGMLALGDMAIERDERSALGDISAQKPNA